ncbi:MAG: archaellin/type IV pilin N-terminal domain-containing protein [Nanoarchaeota archaeon]
MKKSQSEIITAVLLILIVIALAVIILNFSSNFVKNKLSDTGCFDVVGRVSFVSSNKYTCFRDTNEGGIASNDHVILKVHLGDVESVSGLLIALGGANTKSIKIINGAKIDGVKMYGDNSVDPALELPLELPKKNEERTYVIAVTSIPENIKINAIITNENSEKVCETSDSISSLPLCRV